MPRGGRARPRARGRLLAFVLCCALLTAGCTHRSSRPGDPGGASAAPRVGGTLRIALVTPGSLDPAQATSAERRLLVGNLFDSLTTLDPAGTVRPAAAASWSSDQTMRHWRFQLRAGATYADGRAVRAGDFRAAWERLASPRTRPRPASPAALLGIVDGYQAVATGHARTISGIAAPDPATLQIDLSEAFADFPALVADPRFAPVPPDQVAAARAVAGASADGRRRPGLLQGPELGSWSLGFDLDSQQGSDPRWRRAVSLALDRSRIAAAFQGAVVPAVGLVPTGVPGARQVACPTCTYDPGQAGALLDLIGAGARKPVVMAVPSTPFDRQAAGIVKAQLAQVGLPVTIKQVAPASVLSPQGRAGAQLFGFGWASDVPRMDAFLAADPTGFQDEGVERLVAQARATADQAARTRLYQQAEQAALEAVPVAPVLDYRHSAVLAPWVEGFDLTPWGAVDLSACSLANGVK